MCPAGKFQLQLACEILALEFLVLAHIGRDHLLDLARLQQLAQTKAIHTGVVRHHGQIFHAAIAQGVNQCFRNTAQAKTADGDQLSISDHALQCLMG